MRKLVKCLLVSTILSAAGLRVVRADILVENPRHPFGGPASDTSFLYNGIEPYWQLLADDFMLSTPAEANLVTWLGFYGGQFEGSNQPPAGDETMRIRFHSARPNDGLPGQVLYEQDFLNTPRTPTGHNVSDTRSYPEFRFEAVLATPFQINANERYWIEIEQVGIQSSHYRWESSPTNGSIFAVMNPDVLDWVSTVPSNGNLAFQLFGTPEPHALALIILSAFFVSRASRGRRRPPSAMRV